MKLKMRQLSDYEVVSNQSKFCVAKIPKVYKKICVHTTFDVKHDGRHKACVVANSNLTEAPAESVYSGVVSLRLRGLRTCIFLLHPGQLILVMHIWKLKPLKRYVYRQVLSLEYLNVTYLSLIELFMDCDLAVRHLTDYFQSACMIWVLYHLKQNPVYM